MVKNDLTINDVISEMTEDKKECLYYLVGKALNSTYKKRETLIKHSNEYVLPESCIKVKYVLSKLRESEEIVFIFLINKALSDKKNVKR